MIRVGIAELMCRIIVNYLGVEPMINLIRLSAPGGLILKCKIITLQEKDMDVLLSETRSFFRSTLALLKGGIPATPSGTATLLRLSPSYQFYLR